MKCGQMRIFVLYLLGTCTCWGQHIGRLNFTVTPNHYEIFVSPYIYGNEGGPEGTFAGDVKIQMKTREDNCTIILMHAINLNISQSNLTLTTNPANNLLAEEPTYNPTNYTLTFRLSKPLQNDSAITLHIKYTGLIAKDMRGLYLSTYRQNGQMKRMVATQFEDSYAKRFMPCFDEPEFKATFTLSLRRSKNMTAWSNMPLEDTKQDTNSNFVIDKFKKTPLMSTYHLALVIAEFIETPAVNPTQPAFFMISRPEMTNYTTYGLDIGHKILKHLEEFLEYPFKTYMPKIHLAGIPDFKAGAMENPGLVTYRESIILYNAEKTPQSTKRLIASVTVHELAHMWFGNIVTCEWWSYTWLNEGFATYFQHQIIPTVEETFNFLELFNVEVLHKAFRFDSCECTFPMTNKNVTNHPQIRAMFSPISYQKGGSVIRMFEHHMGRENFRKGLVDYIKKRALSTSTPADIFLSLNTTNPAPMEFNNIFFTFTLYPGYPVIMVDVNEDRDSVAITQKRYFARTKAREQDEFWSIPLTYASKMENTFNDTSTKFIMQDKTMPNVTITKSPGWVIFNVQQVGYYRVNYDEKSWNLIIDALKLDNHDEIHVANRAQIIDDLMNLAQSSNVPYSMVFNMLQYLPKEKDYTPWKAALNNLAFIRSRIREESRQIFNTYVVFLIKNVYKQLEFLPTPSDTQLHTFHRQLILSWGCASLYEDCLIEARKQFNLLKLYSASNVHVDIREVVYCVGVREGGEGVFGAIWKMYMDENMQSEQSTLLNALGCTNTIRTVEEYLDKIFSHEPWVRDNMKVKVFSRLICSNFDNVRRTWNYVKKNYAKMSKLLGGYGDVVKYIKIIASRMRTKDELAELQTFIREHGANFGEFKESLEGAEKTLKGLLEWDAKHMDEIVKNIKRQCGSKSSKKQAAIFIIILMSIVLILR